jgi:nicotinamidase/pyrazinamidase
MKDDRVFMDIDTQIDFMDPSGKLYVPHAEELTPNLVRLMTHARQHDILVLSSADAHTPDDAEFKTWSPHCVIGTRGQQRIKETLLPGAMTVSWQPGSFVLPKDWPTQIIIEKDAYDTAANPNFDTILDALGPRRFVVFGVATEYCVRADVLSLRRRNKPVEVVVDAIKPITEEGGRKALDEMAAAGARFVRTLEVLGGTAGRALS